LNIENLTDKMKAMEEAIILETSEEGSEADAERLFPPHMEPIHFTHDERREIFHASECSYRRATGPCDCEAKRKRKGGHS